MLTACNGQPCFLSFANFFQLSVFQVGMDSNASTLSMDISPSNQCLAFGDSANQVWIEIKSKLKLSIARPSNSQVSIFLISSSATILVSFLEKQATFDFQPFLLAPFPPFFICEEIKTIAGPWNRALAFFHCSTTLPLKAFFLYD